MQHKLNGITLSLTENTSGLISSITNNTFLRNVTILAGGTVLGNAIGAISYIFLARLYSPEEFGIYGVFTSILFIMIPIASLRLETAIPLQKNSEGAINVIGSAILVLICFCCLVYICIHFSGFALSVWLKLPQLNDYIWLLPIAAFGGGIFQIFSFIAVRKKRYSEIARAKISQNAVLALTQVVLGFVKVEPIGLIYGEIAGRLSGGLVLFLSTVKNNLHLIKLVTCMGMYKEALANIKFPLYTAPSTLIYSVGSNITPIVITALYGSQVVGLFVFSTRVLAVPVAFIGQAVGQVFLGEAAQLVQGDKRKLTKLFYKTFRHLLFTGVVMFGFIAIFGPWLFEYIFGSQWEASGVFARLLSLMMLTQFVVAPLTHILVVFHRQEMQLLTESLRLLIITTIFGCAYFYNWGASSLIIVYSVGISIFYCIYLYVLISVIRQNVHKPLMFDKQIKL